jgi:hypothetical protein
MTAGRSLKLPPEKSVLKLKVGDVVKLSETDFVRLSKAFFTDSRRSIVDRSHADRRTTRVAIEATERRVARHHSSR